MKKRWTTNIFDSNIFQPLIYMTQSQPQPLNHPYPFQEDGEDSDSDSGRSTVAGEEQFELLDLWRANEMLGETVKKFGNETVFD